MIEALLVAASLRKCLAQWARNDLLGIVPLQLLEEIDVLRVEVAGLDLAHLPVSLTSKVGEQGLFVSQSGDHQSPSAARALAATSDTMQRVTRTAGRTAFILGNSGAVYAACRSRYPQPGTPHDCQMS
jgi:hypothetical protein